MLRTKVNAYLVNGLLVPLANELLNEVYIIDFTVDLVPAIEAFRVKVLADLCELRKKVNVFHNGVASARQTSVLSSTACILVFAKQIPATALRPAHLNGARFPNLWRDGAAWKALASATTDRRATERVTASIASFLFSCGPSGRAPRACQIFRRFSCSRSLDQMRCVQMQVGALIAISALDTSFVDTGPRQEQGQVFSAARHPTSYSRTISETRPFPRTGSHVARFIHPLPGSIFVSHIDYSDRLSLRRRKSKLLSVKGKSTWYACFPEGSFSSSIFET
jgi:hypothetical protein